MNAPAVDLGGRLGLGALAALYRRTSLVIANDTGVSHLAVATGSPSLLLYLKPDRSRFAPLDQVRHRILYDISGIQPREVLKVAQAMLREFPK
jgi:ADP-heptose:LPS heptosyltransferase